MTTPANPDDLLAFVRAQLDDDEAWAERVITAEVQEARAAGVDLTRDEFLTDGGGDWQRWVLAEVDAKRRRLALIDELEGNADDGTWWTKSMADELRKVEALPYVDRPGYREEWRPA